jgi:exopolyphosphatase/guanosine-5'-triphosphate,3'-diphosphate pyrophosphatase
VRVAIIDLGTNSVRFDVHQLEPRGNVRLLHREKIMVRLGQGVFTKGQLDRDAIHRTEHAFTTFKRLCNELTVSRIIALATSALREAIDGPKLIKHIRSKTGIDLKVITGQEEARLIARGILSNEKVTSRGRTALIDIGGGSTEISVAHGRRILRSESFPLGTARLQQLFLKKSPPTEESIEELRAYVRKSLQSSADDHKWPKSRLVIGSSGTIRALSKISRKAGGKKNVTVDELDALIKKMRRMTTTQLLGVPGMEPKRVDMILAGALLLEECMTWLKAKRVMPTEFALRDGIIEEQFELAKKHITSRIALHLPDLIEKAKRLGGDERRLARTLNITELLFRKLKPMHKLDRDWLLYLAAAVVLRDSGEAISLIGHAEHSYYVVKQANFPFIEDWESEFVAQLCRHHEDHKLQLEKLSMWKNGRRQAFLKLLGLLSLVDAMDADPRSPVVIRRVTTRQKEVRIVFSRGSSSDLEVFRVNQRRALFEGVFRKTVALHRQER